MTRINFSAAFQHRFLDSIEIEYNYSKTSFLFSILGDAYDYEQVFRLHSPRTVQT